MLHPPAEILGAPSTRSWDFLLLRVRELAVPPLREARRAERQLNQTHHKYWCRDSMGHRAVWPIRDAGRGKECSGPTLPADAPPPQRYYCSKTERILHEPVTRGGIRLAKHFFASGEFVHYRNLEVDVSKGPDFGTTSIGLDPHTEMSSSPGRLSICSNPARFRYSYNSCGVEQTVIWSGR